MEIKKILPFVVTIVVVMVAAVAIVMLTNSDEKNTTSNNTDKSLDDIYAKLSDFDQILNQDITEEQKENAIKNARTFIEFCEGRYQSHNDSLPEWNDEVRQSLAQKMVENRTEDDPTYEDIYEGFEGLTQHPDYIDLASTEGYYAISGLQESVDEDTGDVTQGLIRGIDGIAIACGIETPLYGSYAGPPSYYETYNRDEALAGVAYRETGKTSIYETWSDAEIVPADINEGKHPHIQYVGF